MTSNVWIRPAEPSDLGVVQDLLTACGLPTEGLEETRLFVLEIDGRVGGLVGYEARGPYALLRSLAVEPSLRGQGYGRRLLRKALDEVGARGFRAAYGLTTTIPEWLRRLGFVEVPRDHLPSELMESAELRGSCCASARAFVLRLGDDPGDGPTDVGTDVRDRVREAYGRIAQGQAGCGCGPGRSDAQTFARFIGYSDQEIAAVPEEANLGLGCGNPTAIAGLRPGEVVLDLGSGAGFDCFLAARQVGSNGRVIGVDMTPEMVEKARAIARQHGFPNVEFRLGEIENLPVADASVDVVISNCVINLSADKPRVFREAYRVLKPGGRIAISDIALHRDLPEWVRKHTAAYVGCVGGAVLVDEYRRMVEAAGFQDVRVTVKAASACTDSDTPDPIGQAIRGALGPSGESCVVSVYVEGMKPV